MGGGVVGSMAAALAFDQREAARGTLWEFCSSPSVRSVLIQFGLTVLIFILMEVFEHVYFILFYFTSLIHPEFILVYGGRKRSSFTLSHTSVQFSQHH